MSYEVKFVLAIVTIYFICIAGYIANIVKLVHCDFNAPYKAEVLRGIGIVVPPVGIIEGYLRINDGKNEHR